MLIPNATVYTDVIRVQTANERIRSSFVVGIAYESDLAQAIAVALEAVRAVEEVGTEPPPEVLLVELGESTVDVEVLFWTDARQIEMRRRRSHAIEAGW